MVNWTYYTKKKHRAARYLDLAALILSQALL